MRIFRLLARVLTATMLALASQTTPAADPTTLQHELGTMSSWYREPTDAEEVVIRGQERQYWGLYADFIVLNHISVGHGADLTRLLAEQFALTAGWTLGRTRHVSTAADQAAGAAIERRIEKLLGPDASAALASYKTTGQRPAIHRQKSVCGTLAATTRCLAALPGARPSRGQQVAAVRLSRRVIRASGRYA